MEMHPNIVSITNNGLCLIESIINSCKKGLVIKRYDFLVRDSWYQLAWNALRNWHKNNVLEEGIVSTACLVFAMGGLNRWLSKRLQNLQCICNGDTAVLH